MERPERLFAAVSAGRPERLLIAVVSVGRPERLFAAVYVGRPERLFAAISVGRRVFSPLRHPPARSTSALSPGRCSHTRRDSETKQVSKESVRPVSERNSRTKRR